MSQEYSRWWWSPWMLSRLRWSDNWGISCHAGNWIGVIILRRLPGLLHHWCWFESKFTEFFHQDGMIGGTIMHIGPIPQGLARQKRRYRDWDRTLMTFCPSSSSTASKSQPQVFTFRNFHSSPYTPQLHKTRWNASMSNCHVEECESAAKKQRFVGRILSTWLPSQLQDFCSGIDADSPASCRHVHL